MSLVVIVVYFSMIKLIIGFLYFIKSELPIYILPTIVLIPSVTLWIAYKVYAYRGRFYITVGLFLMLLVINGLKFLFDDIQVKNFVAWGIINVPPLVGVFLAFFIKKRLCPYLGYMGAKTDSAGRYLFLTEERVQLVAAEKLAAP